MKTRKAYSRGFSVAFGLAAVALVAIFIFVLTRPAQHPAVCPDCNVIIVGIDTLRADRVHAFGYQRETTPNLDKLATNGYVFTNAVSASSWTVPSFMSIMTSVYPSVHKVVNKFSTFNAKEKKISNLKELSPQITTLAEAMRKAGYATGGFTGDAGVSGQFGYKEGFDVYTDEKAFGGLSNSEGHALGWLDSLQKDKKFLMFFHGYDLHGQFDIPIDLQRFVPSGYRGSHTGLHDDEAALREAQLHGPLSYNDADVEFWNGLYDSKIRAADEQLGHFLAELEKRDVLKNTVIIVLSDHGEEWFEHGGIDHGHTLYDELVHVPLVIHVPGGGTASIPGQISTMDVAPTIFDILGIIPDDAFRKQAYGQSLVPYFSGKKDGRDVFLETDYRDAIHKRAVRSADGWKYIRNMVNGEEELYDLNADPAEKQNLISSRQKKADDLKAKLFAHITNDLHADPAARFEVGCLPVYPTECLEKAVLQ